MISKLILPIIAVGMLAFAVNHMRKVHEGVPLVPPLVAPSQAPFQHAIAAYGLVEAQTENIAVSPSQPGLVVDVKVAVGQKRWRQKPRCSAWMTGTCKPSSRCVRPR